VALPAFAAVRRAAARLLVTAGRAAIDRYLLHAGLTQKQTRSSGMHRPDGRDRRTDGRTDARPLHRPHIAYAGSARNHWAK